MSFTSPAQLHETFAKAFTSGDVSTLVDLYEPDAVQIGQDGALAHGQAEIRAVIEQLLAAHVTLQGNQVKTVVTGDLALTSTQYEMQVPGSDGSTGVVLITTAEVSRRQHDGSWRVVVDAPSFA